MGMEQAVTYSGKAVPPWTSVRDLLARRGFPVQVRMIDGELALPDETPPEPWRELRVGTPQGMITVRREPDRVHVVAWGNADAAMLQAWNALTWAFADVAGGTVQTADGARNAAEFASAADLPAALRV
jgi:hypothetical protein